MKLKDGYHLLDICDMKRYTMQVGEYIFDFKGSQLKESIEEYYSYEIDKLDICIISNLEIIASHRGLGLGYKMIKDISIRFQGGCGLIVVEPFPHFLDPKVKSKDLTDWQKLMDLNSFKVNREKATEKLKSYYDKLGFKTIPVCDNLMFLDSIYQNKGMDKIQLN